MKKNAQTILEYILLVGIVTMALVFMGTDFKRALQSVIATTSDQLGGQVNSEQDVDIRQRGYMVNSISNSTQGHQLTKNYTLGKENLIVNDRSQTSSSTVSNVGFTSNEI